MKVRIAISSDSDYDIWKIEANPNFFVLLLGFLTPPELFYVRNHGPVPEVRDEEIPSWDISIEGCVTCLKFYYTDFHIH